MCSSSYNAPDGSVALGITSLCSRCAMLLVALGAKLLRAWCMCAYNADFGCLTAMPAAVAGLLIWSVNPSSTDLTACVA
jgi:hypothetical protein